jgi:hypothetical protein
VRFGVPSNKNIKMTIDKIIHAVIDHKNGAMTTVSSIQVLPKQVVDRMLLAK